MTLRIEFAIKTETFWCSGIISSRCILSPRAMSEGEGQYKFVQLVCKATGVYVAPSCSACIVSRVV